MRAAPRKPAALGVAARFEKENIDTDRLTIGLMVSLSGTLAQAESAVPPGQTR